MYSTRLFADVMKLGKTRSLFSSNSDLCVIRKLTIHVCRSPWHRDNIHWKAWKLYSFRRIRQLYIQHLQYLFPVWTYNSIPTNAYALLTLSDAELCCIIVSYHNRETFTQGQFTRYVIT